jgi:hypothetical protein
MTHSFGLCLSLLFATLAIGCGDGETPDDSNIGNGPKLIRLDSTVLAESDSTFLGKPVLSFAVDSTGQLYIGDAFASRLFRYRRDGALDLAIGRRGDGPGEFRNLIGGTFLVDSFVIQPAGLDLVVFNRHTGAYIGRQRLQMGYFTQGILAGRQLLLANFEYAAKKGIISIRGDSFFEAVRGESREPLSSNLIPLPAEYSRYPELGNSNWSEVAAWNDTVLSGYAALPYLTVNRGDGTPLDTITIPTRRRRGFPPGSYQIFRKGTTASTNEQARAISILQALWRLPNGNLIVGYRDSWTTGVGADEHYFGRIWLTILARDLKRACVDVEVPFPGTDWPRLGFQGDTIYALDQVGYGNGDSLRVASIVYRYLLSEKRCTWVSVGHRSK